MSKKRAATIELTISLLIVVIVVISIISYGPEVWELIKISIGFGEINEPENKGDGATPNSQANQIAESDYNRFTEFLQKLNQRSFANQCKTTFIFSDKYPLNFFILISNNGKIQLKSAEAGEDKILKTESANFIPYGDLSSDSEFNKYFNNYGAFNNNYLIKPSAGSVIRTAGNEEMIVPTKTIVAVSKDNKWFLTKSNSFIDDNAKFPDCYNPIT